MLNLEVEAGNVKGFRTAAVRVDAFGHPVMIETYSGTNELTGRAGWLDVFGSD
jgi:hypothetical protein